MEETTGEETTGHAADPARRQEARTHPEATDDEFAAAAGRDGDGGWSLRDLRVPTWELELLISGAVVFTLFRVPEILNREVSQALLVFPESLFLLVFLGVVYLQTAAYVLTASFIFHLAARAYWIGLIGLHSIFPQGVGWENVKTGPRLRETYRRQLPPTPVLIEKAGALCSGIFSFSFSIVLVILMSAAGGGVLFGIGLALQTLVFSEAEFQTVFYAVLGAVFGPFLALMTLDKLFAERNLSPRLESLLRRGLDFYTRIFGSKLVNAIQLTFFSNVKRRYVYPIFYVIFFGSLMLTLVRVTFDLGVLEVSGFDHFPSVRDDAVAQAAFYRDQARTDDARSAQRPSIQSDIVEEPYVKLFLPHTPRHDDVLAEVCPDLEPLRSESVVRLVPRDADYEPQLLEETRRCLAAIWTVRLDDETLTDLDFEFHVRPSFQVRGLLTYLPTRALEPGRHVLRLERRRASSGREKDDNAGKDETGKEDTSVYEIPFWI